MKKYALISLLICSAVMLFPGCSEVGNTNDNSGSDNSEITAEVTTEEEIPEDEMPTMRVPEIQTADEFKYEILDGGAVITAYVGSSASVEIPSELGGSPVTEIGFYAFEAKYNIEEIILPDTLITIGEGAFMDCESLVSITIPESVVGIDRGAFVSCTRLAQLTIPENVQYIREETFTACEALTSLTIENPDLAYENWGLEDLPELTIYAPEDSAAAAWAEAMGKFSA